jgi:hypothetical protein
LESETANLQRNLSASSVGGQCISIEEREKWLGSDVLAIRVVGHFKKLRSRRCNIEYYVHNVPGRLRVKTPLIRRNHHLAQEVYRLLSALYGIDAVVVKVVTGSIVVHYNPVLIQSRQIVETLTQSGYFDPSKAITHDKYVHDAFSKTGNVVWKAVFGAFVDQALEGSALSLITILI